MVTASEVMFPAYLQQCTCFLNLSLALDAVVHIWFHLWASQLVFSNQPGPCCSWALPQLWRRLGNTSPPLPGTKQTEGWWAAEIHSESSSSTLFQPSYQFGVQVELYCEWEISLSGCKQLLLSAGGFCHPRSCACGFASGCNSSCCTCIKFGSNSSSFLTALWKYRLIQHFS